MSSALTADGVTFAVASRRLVDNVSLEVETGELVAIVGPNGAGKSTLLQLLAGEIQPDAGTVHLNGRPLAQLSPREIALERAVMPQHTTLQFAFTVEAVVAMGRHPHKATRTADTAAVARAMHDADIVELAHRSYPTLSGGERQRVTFARILAQQTPLLLLDEPTSSLDLHHQEHLMTLARTTVERGGTAITVLHDLNLAAAYADRLCLLHQGQLIATGTPAEILLHAPLERVFNHPLTINTHPPSGNPTITPKRRRIKNNQ